MNDNEFFKKYEGPVFRVASKFTPAPQEAEDLTMEILMKAISRRGGCKTKNVDGWVHALATNYCKDRYRATKTKKALKTIAISDAAPDLSTEGREGIETVPAAQIKYPFFHQLKATAPDIATGLERSLEMVHDFFAVITILRKEQKSFKPLLDARQALDACWAKVEEALPPPPSDVFFAYKAYKTKARDQFGNRSREGAAKYRAYEAAAQIFNHLFEDSLELGHVIRSHPINFGVGLERQTGAVDLFCVSFVRRVGSRYGLAHDRLDLIGIKVDALKLLYNIWTRALRKGKYQNRRLLENLLVEFREMKRGTELAYIFSPLDRDKSMESLRTKALYGLTEITNDLAAYIFRGSFPGQPDPTGPTIFQEMIFLSPTPSIGENPRRRRASV